MKQAAKVIPFDSRFKRIHTAETEPAQKTVLVNQVTFEAIVAAHSVMNALMASLIETSEVQP